jgi:hypothetical protein
MKKVSAAFCLLLLGTTMLSQNNYDIGISLGGANYLGDIGGDELTRRDFIWDMKMNQTSLAAGGFFRTKFSNDLGFKASLNWGRIKGSDANSTNPGRRGRNLNFRNDLIEFAARGEYYFHESYDVGGYGRYLVAFRPYVFGGIGLVYSNPKAELDGAFYALRQLKTEGQSNPYSPVTMVLPTGIGFYFTFSKQYRMGWELGYRHTFSDYLDDVSGTYTANENLNTELAQLLANRRPELGNEPDVPREENYKAGQKRGDAVHNDSYLFSELSFSYVVRKRPYGPVWIGDGGKRKGKRTVRWKSKYSPRKSF